ADDVGADDQHRAARPGARSRAEVVVDRPVMIDALEIGAGDGEPARLATGREQKLLVPVRLAAAIDDLPAYRIERDDAGTGDELDPPPQPEFLRLDGDCLERLASEPQVLAQRWAVIGRMRLGTNQQDRSTVPLADAVYGGSARHARPDDHVPVSGHHAPPPLATPQSRPGAPHRP